MTHGNFRVVAMFKGYSLQMMHGLMAAPAAHIRYWGWQTFHGVSTAFYGAQARWTAKCPWGITIELLRLHLAA